jgi:uncharacterized protein YbaR (Trm112 family)
MSKEGRIYVLLICPDCHNDLFNVFDNGDIVCSKCKCEICAETGEPETIH